MPASSPLLGWGESEAPQVTLTVTLLPAAMPCDLCSGRTGSDVLCDTLDAGRRFVSLVFERPSWALRSLTQSLRGQGLHASSEGHPCPLELGCSLR